MLRSSARAYVEPLAALAAVFALGAGLTLYATTLQGTQAGDGREVAETVVASLTAQAESLGVVRPERLDAASVPAGWQANVTLATPAGRWTRGRAPPPAADRARRQVAVRLAPGRVRPGTLRVAVWR